MGSWSHLETWRPSIFKIIAFFQSDRRDRHNQQSKKKAGEAALKAGNHEEAHRLFSEACDVDKHNKKYRWGFNFVIVFRGSLLMLIQCSHLNLLGIY